VGTAEEARISLARLLLSKRGLAELPAEKVVEMALEHRNPAVAFSGGKSSLVVLHMAWLRKPDIKAVFNNTGVEIPGTVEYVRRLAREWGFELIETEPVKPDPSSPEPAFWQCWRLFGPPAMRGSPSARASRGRKNKQHPECCLYLKELPALKAYRENFIDAVIRGIQAGESRMRAFTVGENGQRHWNRKYLIFTYDPIALWSEEQVWEYIRRYGLPYNPAYDRGFKRTGCLPCTAHKDWPRKLAKTYPKMRDFLLAKLGHDEKGNRVLLQWVEGRVRAEMGCTSYA
jgi:phosphoadenosine phosphosulfate reductase